MPCLAKDITGWPIPAPGTWLIGLGGALQNQIVCPFLLQLVKWISRQGPLWWKLHLLHLGRFLPYCFTSIGAVGVVSAQTTTVCYFLEAGCVVLPFFLSQNFVLLLVVLVHTVTMVVVVIVVGSSWSMSLCTKSLALLNVVGFEDKTLPWNGGNSPQMYLSIFLILLGTMFRHNVTNSLNLVV